MRSRQEDDNRGQKCSNGKEPEQKPVNNRTSKLPVTSDLVVFILRLHLVCDKAQFLQYGSQFIAGRAEVTSDALSIDSQLPYKK